MRNDENQPEKKPELFDPMHEMEPVESVGYEVRDFLGRKGLFMFGTVHIIGLTSTLLLCWWLQAIFIAHAPAMQRSPMAEQPKPAVQAAKLQALPNKDITEFHQEEESRLNSYGWVDKQAGTVYIPIEQAIEKTAESGLPSRAQDMKGTGK